MNKEVYPLFLFLSSRTEPSCWISPCRNEAIVKTQTLHLSVDENIIKWNLSHHGHALVTLYVQFLRSDRSKWDRWVHAENLYKRFVSSCNAFNCLFPLDVQNEIPRLSRFFCYLWPPVKVIGNTISDGIVFVAPCLMRKRFEKSQAILALLDGW